VDLPNDEVSKALVEGVLKALGHKYSNPFVAVDLTTKNASRISKVYGTTARKGESVPKIGRVHRPSAILEVPESLEPADKAALQKLAGEAPAKLDPRQDGQSGRGKLRPQQYKEFDLARWVEDHDVPVKSVKEWNGAPLWVLESCPWNGHEDGAAWIGRRSEDGPIVGGCLHDSCSEHGWADIREHYQPGYKERQTQNAPSSDSNDSNRGAKGEGNQAQRLISYALADAGELFLDQNGAEHALVDGAPVPLDRGCYGWLRRLFWDHEETAASTDLLGTVAGQLKAFAEVSGNEHTLHLRAAQHEGAVYLYLGPGRVVRCDAYGWEIDHDTPVMFRRVLNLKELPDPERGGSLDLLDAFITAKEPRDHRLAKTWLALVLLADLPRPILLAHGPQGATKSSVQRVLKNVIDPAKPTTLKLRDKDFEQNINKAFIPFFDNVSTITDHMADELSKAVTGAGNAVRKLYEDDADIIREYKRAMLLNGLIIPTEKADLIDRILPVALKRVPPAGRKTERRMQALFEERHPKLLGAVLDALSGALGYHEEVEGLPRLADWAEYAIALYKHLGWDGYKGFMDDWAVIEEGQHAITLEGSALAQAAVAVVAEHGTVQESPSEMLSLLHEAAESEGLNPDKDKEFPKHANWLWRRLVPVIPTLESFGITASEVRDNAKGRKRFIRLEKDTLPSPGPEGSGQHNAGSDSTENMLSVSDPHAYADPTARTARTAYFSENSKYTEDRIDRDDTHAVLQGRKNGVRAVRSDESAYLSGKSEDTIDTISGDAARTDTDAVRKPQRTPNVKHLADYSRSEGGGPPRVPNHKSAEYEPTEFIPLEDQHARVSLATELEEERAFAALVSFGEDGATADKWQERAVSDYRVPAESFGDAVKFLSKRYKMVEEIDGRWLPGGKRGDAWEGNHPDDYYSLTPEEQDALISWINENLVPSEDRYLGSYGLKHHFERAPEGFYITNGQFKGAMRAAGCEPSEADKGPTFNWFFRLALKQPEPPEPCLHFERDEDQPPVCGMCDFFASERNRLPETEAEIQEYLDELFLREDEE
jgi:hypothetical protein